MRGSRDSEDTVDDMRPTDNLPVNTWLQDAVELAVENIGHRLDTTQGDRPFFWFDLKSSPPALRHDYWDFCDMSGRWTNAVMLARLMTGLQKPELERRLKEYLLARQGDDGLFYNQAGDTEAFIVIGEVPKGDFADMFCQSRVMVALTTWYLETGSADIEERIERLLARLREILPRDGEAYRAPAIRHLRGGGWQKEGGCPDLAPGFAASIAPMAMRYHEANGSKAALDLARGLLKGFVFTEGRKRGDRFYFRPDGMYFGNTHWGGGLLATAAAVRLARATGDDRMMGFCRRVFENIAGFTTDFGWTPNGVNVPEEGQSHGQCEICNITDAIDTALQLIEGEAGDYRDFIDAAVRNQVIEQQFRDPSVLLSEEDLRRSRQPIAEGLRGSVESWGNPNSLVGNASGLEGCCTGALVHACYFAWQHTIEERSGRVWIHLPFSRACPQLDLLCHEPWRGAMTLKIKKACSVSLRLPKWIANKTLNVRCTERALETRFNGRYLLLDHLAPGDTVRLTYPLPETRREYRIDGESYTGFWRGGTVVEMTPRGEPYPIYQRKDRLETLPARPPRLGCEFSEVVW